VASIGALGELLYHGSNNTFHALFILGAKFGVAATFNLVYVATGKSFPVAIVVFPTYYD
jgi:hypothetical protein